MDTEKTENSEAAAVAARKRPYIPQTDIPNPTLDDALRVPRAVVENDAGKAATPLQVASALKRREDNPPLPRHDFAPTVLVGMGVPRESTESVYPVILDTA